MVGLVTVSITSINAIQKIWEESLTCRLSLLPHRQPIGLHCSFL